MKPSTSLLLAALTLLLLGTTAFAQPDSLWSRTYGGSSADIASAVIQTSDGGYAITGYTSSFLEPGAIGSFWLVKADERGDSLWSRTFPTESGAAYSIVETPQRGLMIAGNAYFGVGMYLTALDENGELLWNRMYGGDSAEQCHSIVRTMDGCYALGGISCSFGSGDADFWLIKINENGDSLWSKTIGDSATDRCNAMIQTRDGGYAMAGESHSNFSLARLDQNGDSLWMRYYGGPRIDNCNSLVQLTTVRKIHPAVAVTDG